MAIGCSHGDLIHQDTRKQVLDFKRRFKPEIRFELGDLIDTACFRSGAAGTKDEAVSPRNDHVSAIRWMQDYEPTRICYGNHDWRLHELQSHPKAIVAELSRIMWTSLTNQAKKLKAKTAPYDIKKGWIDEGGVMWGHGYGMGGVNALRQHIGWAQGRCVIAHLHRPQQIAGQTIEDSDSFCVGALADDEKLEYGRRRGACLDHGPGIVFGECSEKESHLWLIRAESGKPLHFPPGL